MSISIATIVPNLKNPLRNRENISLIFQGHIPIPIISIFSNVRKEIDAETIATIVVVNRYVNAVANSLNAP